MNRKKANLLIKVLAMMVLLVIAAGVIIILGKSRLDEYQEENDSLYEEMESNRQVVYVAKEREDMLEPAIQKGDILIADGEEANVIRQEIYTGLEPDFYITENDLGSTAIVDMNTDTPIMKNMITSLYINHDTREYELSAVHLMLDQKPNDMVDIRISYPNGEDYLVLPKKKVTSIVLDSSIFHTYLNEEEILRYTSAVVDAYTMTGARLYTTRYVEGNIQNEGVPNYLVKPETMDLMSTDPNITTLAQKTLNLAARLDMEQRMSGLTEEQLDAVSNGYGLEDTAKTSILSTGINFVIPEEEETEDSSSLESTKEAEPKEEEEKEEEEE